MKNLQFKARGFVSLLTMSSFLISLVSGIILYFAPQGKIANWTDWTIWGLDKHTWGALHINSSLILFVIIGFHIYYNWKVLLGYLRKKARETSKLKLELLVTLLISLFIIFASIYDTEPFATVIRWNNDIKTYWARTAEDQPPVPHAESWSVTEFCKNLHIPKESFKQKLNQQGWQFKDYNESIESLAKRNNISPADIFKVLKTTTAQNTEQAKGWGRKTVQNVCQEFGKDVDEVVKKFANKGITVSKDDLIKNIADNNNFRPYEVVEIIKSN